MASRGSARDRLIGRVHREWTAFEGSLESLPEAAFLETGVVGDWSLRDLMVHITSWEEEALKAIPVILEDRRLPRYRQVYGGIDAFNAMEQQAKAHLSLERVRADMQACHQRLLSHLTELTDESLKSGGRLARRLRQDTYDHYREHMLHVVEWRQQRDP